MMQHAICLFQLFGIQIPLWVQQLNVIDEKRFLYVIAPTLDTLCWSNLLAWKDPLKVQMYVALAVG